LAAGIILVGWQIYRRVSNRTPPDTNQERTSPEIRTGEATLLVYEVDTSRFPNGVPPADFTLHPLIKALQVRIDPTGEAGVVIRPAGELRVEVSVPHRHKDHDRELSRVRDLISHPGKLQFVIVANPDDDREAIDAAKAYFERPPPTAADILDAVAADHRPPPGPLPPDGRAFHIVLGKEKVDLRYSWVELGPTLRKDYRLSNEFENTDGFWDEMKAARDNQKTLEHFGQLLYSRSIRNPDQLPPEQRSKKYEYFMLCRDPEINPEGRSTAVGGQDLREVHPEADPEHGFTIAFSFNDTGSRLLADLTTKNKERQLAVVLDDQIQSVATIRQPLTKGAGILYGNYTEEQVESLVNILRAGALPVALKPVPVSETTVGPAK
jgi:SecD/SecF fusion protein